MARTAVTQKLLQTAIKDCQRSHIRFQACLNSFNMLSNTQFMESRVREEDSNTVKPKDHVQEPSNITGTQDNPENQRITEVRSLPSFLGPRMINLYFTAPRSRGVN